jgi:hypothetical protein
VSVPFVYTRGDSTPAAAAHVTFQLDPALRAVQRRESRCQHPHRQLARELHEQDVPGPSTTSGAACTPWTRRCSSLPCGPTTGGRAVHRGRGRGGWGRRRRRGP